MSTNPTTPELLGDEDLKEIEARPWVYPYLHNTEQRVLLKVAERDALVQTARALREQLAEEQRRNQMQADTIMEYEGDVAALRDQLAQAQAKGKE